MTANPNSSERVDLGRIVLIVLVVIVNLGLVSLGALSAFHIVKVFRVPNKAMIPTIDPGDQIFACTWGLQNGLPARGDVVVFRSEGIPILEDRSPAEWLIKRVVGLPGDVLSLHSDGKLWINGAPTPQFTAINYRAGREYLKTEDETYLVPPQSYFVLGDNSESSYDSRYWGCVPMANIKGRVMLIFWPLSRFAWIK